MTATEGRPVTGSIEPVQQSVTVDRAAEDAFRLFTAGASSWWPLDSHSVHGADTVECVFEQRGGGRIYERTADGREVEWGRMKVWDPPRRFVCSWYPGHPADRGQELEVRFQALDGGRTRVELEHRGWELLGEKAAEARADYDEGWAYVFGERYAQRADEADDTRTTKGTEA
jgi:uncharacterized protein YndB with AHSA1/START domain